VIICTEPPCDCVAQGAAVVEGEVGLPAPAELPVFESSPPQAVTTVNSRITEMSRVIRWRRIFSIKAPKYVRVPSVARRVFWFNRATRVPEVVRR
jgi:hypothetical protein